MWFRHTSRPCTAALRARALSHTHLDAMPFNHLAVLEDPLQLSRAFILLDDLKRGTAAHGIVDKYQRLGLVDGTFCLAKAICAAQHVCRRGAECRAMHSLLLVKYPFEANI